MPRRYLRRALIGVAGLIVGVVVVFPLVSSYGQTHIGRAVVPDAELGAAFEDVSFTTDDGLELQGWYVPSKNRAAVIAFPGRKGPQQADQDAGPPRVRRAAVRPARRGRQ